MSILPLRFVAGPGLIGAGIRWSTDSLFQHVEIGTPEGTWIGAHAEGGLLERPGNYANYTREYLYHLPCSDLQLNQMLVYARSKIGTPYNFRDIAGLLLHDRDLTSAKLLICSQFATDVLLTGFGANRVLNVQVDYTYLITPEILHLSPIFVGNLASKRG